jgi:hypothetical protein
MKETYVEEIAPRCWVVLSQILWDSACRKALTVECNAKMIDHMCFWPTGGEFVSIIRPFEATTHLICCVVIATNHGDAYVSLVESCKAGDEFKAAFIVTPVAVENVAGDHNKIDFFVDSESDHFPKSAQSRAGNILGSAVSAFSQPSQGAVEMKIGGVNKSHECPTLGEMSGARLAHRFLPVHFDAARRDQGRKASICDFLRPRHREVCLMANSMIAQLRHHRHPSCEWLARHFASPLDFQNAFRA